MQKIIEMASQRVPQGKFILGDMRELKLTQKFDAIIAWNSLFHLTADEQKNMFKTFIKHLNDSGILMFTTGSEAGEIWRLASTNITLSKLGRKYAIQSHLV